MTGPPEPAADLRCRRVLLLVSLGADGAATPEQTREIDDHLPSCAACRRAAAADRATGDRLRERAEGAPPAGFSARVTAAAIAQHAAILAENRFLRRAAIAAVLVAGISVGATFAGRRPIGAGGDSVASAGAGGDFIASARDVTRSAVIRPRHEGR